MHSNSVSVITPQCLLPSLSMSCPSVPSLSFHASLVWSGSGSGSSVYCILSAVRVCGGVSRVQGTDPLHCEDHHITLYYIIFICLTFSRSIYSILNTEIQDLGSGVRSQKCIFPVTYVVTFTFFHNHSHTNSKVYSC
jgi:hypothetical protein